MLELIHDAVFNNDFLYSTILMFVLSSFIGAMVIIALKSYNIVSNNYYTILFEKDLWTQSLSKNIDNAELWTEKSTLVKMFSEGVKTFIGQYRQDSSYNYGSNLELTKGTMRVILKKDYECFNEGFNILAFNSLFIPYTTLCLAISDIVVIFQTVSLDVLELSVFVKPMVILGIGLFCTCITTILYMLFQNRLDHEKEKLELFVEEFSNFLHRNFYTKEVENAEVSEETSR